MAFPHAVAILTRAPLAGGGKRRIFAELGRAIDPALLEALLLDTVEALVDPRWDCVLAVEPASRCREVAATVPLGVRVTPQSTGSLGERMGSTIARLLAEGAGAVVLVGSDLPTAQPDLVAAAFEVLDADPDAVVLGPADDGGFYLIGAARDVPALDGVAWGGTEVLAQTSAVLARAGVRVRLITAHADVDTVADLRQLVAGTLPGSRPSAARRTRAWAARHLP